MESKGEKFQIYFFLYRSNQAAREAGRDGYRLSYTAARTVDIPLSAPVELRYIFQRCIVKYLKTCSERINQILFSLKMKQLFSKKLLVLVFRDENYVKNKCSAVRKY